MVSYASAFVFSIHVCLFSNIYVAKIMIQFDVERSVHPNKKKKYCEAFDVRT